jgi:hypothetical protein
MLLQFRWDVNTSSHELEVFPTIGAIMTVLRGTLVFIYTSPSPGLH